MRPNFALILSMEGIALLQRSAPGWSFVGEANPESPRLSEEMAALRRAADRLPPAYPTPRCGRRRSKTRWTGRRPMRSTNWPSTVRFRAKPCRSPPLRWKPCRRRMISPAATGSSRCPSSPCPNPAISGGNRSSAQPTMFRIPPRSNATVSRCASQAGSPLRPRTNRSGRPRRRWPRKSTPRSRFPCAAAPPERAGRGGRGGRARSRPPARPQGHQPPDRAGRGDSRARVPVRHHAVAGDRR